MSSTLLYFRILCFVLSLVVQFSRTVSRRLFCDSLTIISPLPPIVNTFFDFFSLFFPFVKINQLTPFFKYFLLFKNYTLLFNFVFIALAYDLLFLFLSLRAGYIVLYITTLNYFLYSTKIKKNTCNCIWFCVIIK